MFVEGKHDCLNGRIRSIKSLKKLIENITIKRNAFQLGSEVADFDPHSSSVQSDLGVCMLFR